MTESPTKSTRRPRVPLTDEIVARLRQLRYDTGVGASMLMRGTRGEAPRGLNSAVIRSWLNEKTRTAYSEHIHYVENRWQAILDSNQQRVVLSPDDWQRLIHARKTSGISLRRTVADPGCPEDLSLGMLQNYCGSKPAAMPYHHLIFLQEIWMLRKSSDVPPPPPRIEITNEIHDTLSRYLSLGYLPGPIFDSPSSPPPPGLSPQMISRWLSQGTRTAQPAHLEWVFRECAAMLSKPQRPIHITETMHSEFMLLREFTELGPLAIFKCLHPLPPGLTAAMISAWSQQTTCIAQHCHWTPVMAILREKAERRAIMESRRHDSAGICAVYDPLAPPV